MRGAAAVVAGLCVMLLSRYVPGGSLITAVLSVLALAIVAGFITAFIAGRNQFRFAGLLGTSMVLLAFAAMRAHGIARPGWYEIALGGCGPMAAFLGAGLCLLLRPKR